MLVMKSSAMHCGDITEEVLAQTVTDSTDSAVYTMVYMLVLIVIPKFTLRAVVKGHAFGTFRICTILRHCLCRRAEHAQHHSRLRAN